MIEVYQQDVLQGVPIPGKTIQEKLENNMTGCYDLG